MIHLKQILAESKLKMSIPSDIKKLYKLFIKNKKQLYVVGGAVRDAILGKSPKDFDLTTDASPDEVIAIAKQGKFKHTDLVGKAQGVIIVNGHEIATFRKDIGKGRRPDAVEFTPDIKIDVQRRDLTVNALYYDIGKGQIVDVVGGIKDLQKRQARTVGDPDTRFEEDPLRKLRAVRFAGVLNGKMHKDTWNSLKNNPDLSMLSGERIRDEFLKGIKKSKKVSTYLKMLSKLGMFKDIFPGLKINLSFENSKDYIVQVATLLKGNTWSKVLPKLKSAKWFNQEVKDIIHLLKLDQFNSDDILTIKREEKNTKLTDNQVKQFASISGNGSNILKVWKFKLSVTSKDAIEKGLTGKAIGDYIRDKEIKLFLNK
tara:strand:+ start:1340 stop:2452 length:1113 start_codon:yes stop_codon:yes gene_type:complete